MPVPAKIQPGAARLRIDRNFAFIQLTGYREPRLEAAAARLVEHVSRKTGIPMASGHRACIRPPRRWSSIAIMPARPCNPSAEDESYRLTVTARGRAAGRSQSAGRDARHGDLPATGRSGLLADSACRP